MTVKRRSATTPAVTPTCALSALPQAVSQDVGVPVPTDSNFPILPLLASDLREGDTTGFGSVHSKLAEMSDRMMQYMKTRDGDASKRAAGGPATLEMVRTPFVLLGAAWCGGYPSRCCVRMARHGRNFIIFFF